MFASKDNIKLGRNLKTFSINGGTLRVRNPRYKWWNIKGEKLKEFKEKIVIEAW